ncbi:MAG: extracellular solute-binding protein [Lachnospiraceae bacterium]|nr:extracellular solute-binding protein [Lachnospiraceae bacterium]
MQREAKKGKGIWIALIICLALVALGIVGWILKPGIQYRLTMSKADQYFEAKQYEEAIEAYEKAGKIKASFNAEEKLFEAYLALAKRQLEDGEYKDAIGSAKDAAFMKESDKANEILFDARLGLAEKYIKAEKYGKARKQINYVLAKDPENERAATLADQVEQLTTYGYQVKPVDPVDPVDPPVVTKERIDLTIWTTITEDNASYHALQQALSEMSQDYTGEVTYSMEAFSAYEYKYKIKAAIAAGETPDIFYCSTGDLFETVVDAGVAYSLDDVYRQYSDLMLNASLYPVTRNGHVFGIPTTYSVDVMYVNMNVLRSVGYDTVPVTFDELMECCEALKDAGIVPFACGGNEIWTVMEYVELMMIKSMPAKDLDDVLRCRTTWKDQRIADAVNVFAKMCEQGYIAGAENESYNDMARQMLIDDKAAFYVNGSWNCADFYVYGDGKISVCEFPFLSDEADVGAYIGGPQYCMCVANRSPHAEIAAEYAFELARRMSHYEVLDGCGIPAFKLYGDTSVINPMILHVTTLCQFAQALIPYGDAYVPEAYLGDYTFAYIGLFDGEVTGEEFIQYLYEHIQ